MKTFIFQKQLLPVALFISAVILFPLIVLSAAYNVLKTVAFSAAPPQGVILLLTALISIILVGMLHICKGIN